MLLRRTKDPTGSSASRSSVIDPEFGVVECRRTDSRYVRVRVDEHGKVYATLPRRAPLRYVEQLLDSSRTDIRKMLTHYQSQQVSYTSGMNIGHSHRLFIEQGSIDAPKRKLSGQQLTITLPLGVSPETTEARAYISKEVKKLLRREASAYLPRRLDYLAETYGFEYNKIRFGNPKGRWGSCSSSGTISLNVALMNTPHDVIDYVLIHELSHTKQMNHSPAFWALVESCVPNYKALKKTLKSMSPIC